MIGYIQGEVLKVAQDGILLLAGQLGYEILLPVVVLEKIRSELEAVSQGNNIDKNVSVDTDFRNTQSSKADDVQILGNSAGTNFFIALHIYYYQTERQPKPVLIGFNSEDEKEFFQLFISVDAIGPLKAVKAMEKPVGHIARAIESKDVDFLSHLKGIGKRTAQKIVASLHGKVSRFVTGSMDNHEVSSDDASFGGTVYKGATASSVIPATRKIIGGQVVDVLVEQLGFTSAVARRMVSIAIEKNPAIETPEQLLDAVLKLR
ncbi:Holliday junction ATP-dependent DNA helicase RuvA [Desulfamplus magnetovallimortis]|uniref:Holliday junction branch migration complex subunit RuvA n=1 Tax=Desulfamplus magnetovallimortis TaxID=1246637 RepID=A0A1W1HKR8_9BACT|nr:Holliday junction branch migration protein RuvA [Desulfamplus magnetovallimortis]SLM32948.1 Holliday junction ATP-dependent DNA helicase RuvA [Desulfamplus magnetovallimortis]